MTPKERSPRKAAGTCQMNVQGLRAVVGNGVRKVVQRVVEGIQVHAEMLRKIQGLPEGGEHGFLGIRGGDQQAAAAGVGHLVLEFFEGPGVAGIDLHGAICLLLST